MTASNERRIDTGALVRAGTYTALVLYVLCLAFFLLVYGGRGEWMIAPFMPGVGRSAWGFLLGAGWAVAYGAGISWLIATFYNGALGRRPAT